jgi:hypothetical protein
MSVFDDQLVLKRIAGFLCKRDYLSLLLTCKQAEQDLTETTKERKRTEKNHLLYLLKNYPNKQWEWYGLGRNPNISMEYIGAHLDKHWDWESVSQNPNLTPEFVEAHIDKPWDWFRMSHNRFGV